MVSLYASDMITFAAGPRVRGDDLVVGVLRRLATGELPVDDALFEVLELSSDPDFDGEIASEAVLIAAEFAEVDDLEPAKDLLLGLLVSSGEWIGSPSTEDRLLTGTGSLTVKP